MKGKTNMIENNKKTRITRDRWAFILDFLASEEQSVRSLLASSVHPDMVRADVYLTNATTGDPKLVADVVVPDGGEKLLVFSVQRPGPYYPGRLQRQIEGITFYEMISTVVNQIDVE
jgi:hypothetical protein